MFMVIAITVFKSSDIYHGIKTDDMSTIFRGLGDGQVKKILRWTSFTMLHDFICYV